MTFLPLFRRILNTMFVLSVVVMISCAHHTTTQKNIKKVNAAFKVKEKDAVVVPKEPAKKADEGGTGAIPLSQFLDAKSPIVLQSVNPWFPKLQDWARTYAEIAKTESDVRNYVLSDKYSTIALTWAHRSLQIKDLPSKAAMTYIKTWVDQIPAPKLPETRSYFTAQEAYTKISYTREKFMELQNRVCLISAGFQIVQAAAFLDLSTDLFNQKKYAKAIYHIQSGAASLDNITKKDIRKCNSPDEDDSTHQNSE